MAIFGHPIEVAKMGISRVGLLAGQHRVQHLFSQGDVFRRAIGDQLAGKASSLAALVIAARLDGVDEHMGGRVVIWWQGEVGGHRSTRGMRVG